VGDAVNGLVARAAESAAEGKVGMETRASPTHASIPRVRFFSHAFHKADLYWSTLSCLRSHKPAQFTIATHRLLRGSRVYLLCFRAPCLPIMTAPHLFTSRLSTWYHRPDIRSPTACFVYEYLWFRVMPPKTELDRGRPRWLHYESVALPSKYGPAPPSSRALMAETTYLSPRAVHAFV
jgi:hypothetical protein